MISIIKAKAMLADSQFIYVVEAADVAKFEPKVPVRYTHVDGLFLYGADVELKEFKGKEIQPFGEDFDVVEAEAPVELAAILPAPTEAEVAAEVAADVAATAA